MKLEFHGFLPPIRGKKTKHSGKPCLVNSFDVLLYIICPDHLRLAFPSEMIAAGGCGPDRLVKYYFKALVRKISHMTFHRRLRITDLCPIALIL